MIADKIKALREGRGITQAELARRLGITRSGVNAWEMGITVPSTQYVVELALLFNVSSDYLLDLPITKTLPVDGLNDAEISALLCLIDCLKSRGNKNENNG